MTAFLWTYFILGGFTTLCRAIIVGSGKTTHVTPAQHLTNLLIGIGFLIWVGVLLFGGAS